MLPKMLVDPYVEVALQAPPSPDYILGPEEPEQAPPSPDYVPGPEYADDEIVAEDQPYAEDASPIAQSPEYVPKSDFEAYPEDDEDPEEDPVDYLADGGDDNDDEEESSEDDEDDEDDYMDAPSAEETEPFETDESAATPPHPAYRMTVRIFIPAPVPMPAWTDSEVVRLLAISSPPASPLSPRDEAASTSSPPLQLPSASRREDRPEVTLPPRKRLDIALGPRYEVGESSYAAVARPAGGLRDRRAHAYTRHLMETEGRMSREAWVRATDASDLVQELLRIDHKRSIEILELRTALQGQVIALQVHVTTLQGQQGLAGGPTQSELPEEAGGSA
nr:hypothetical protein [Tanacetum cinerariifolium]